MVLMVAGSGRAGHGRAGDAGGGGGGEGRDVGWASVRGENESESESGSRSRAEQVQGPCGGRGGRATRTSLRLRQSHPPPSLAAVHVTTKDPMRALLDVHHQHHFYQLTASPSARPVLLLPRCCRARAGPDLMMQRTRQAPLGLGSTSTISHRPHPQPQPHPHPCVSAHARRRDAALLCSLWLITIIPSLHVLNVPMHMFL